MSMKNHRTAVVIRKRDIKEEIPEVSSAFLHDVGVSGAATPEFPPSERIRALFAEQLPATVALLHQHH